MSRLQMTVNGTAVDIDVPQSRYLSEVLREDLRLTGTKIGCKRGRVRHLYRSREWHGGCQLRIPGLQGTGSTG